MAGRFRLVISFSYKKQQSTYIYMNLTMTKISLFIIESHRPKYKFMLQNTMGDVKFYHNQTTRNIQKKKSVVHINALC